MNRVIHGICFDGETLAGKPVALAVATGRLQDTGPAAALDVSLADVRISDRLANVPRFLYLPGNLTVETADNAAIDELLDAQQRGRLVSLIHALEIHARGSAAATVIVVITTVAAIWWGLPILARQAAMAVPAGIEQQAGRAGLATINKVLARSNLAPSDQRRVQAQLDRLMLAGGIPGKPQIVYRSMGGKFPNAFALPGGIIVVSDELVELVDHDDEIAAVLAHEIGHWQRRHGLQGVLRSSTALLVVTTVTGDLSTLTTFAGTIPFTILQRGYSREFEAEADRYAVDLLKKAGISAYYFRSILEKLETSRPTAGQDLTYLSTHPSTGDRIGSLALPATPPPGATKLPPAGSRKTEPLVALDTELSLRAQVDKSQEDAVKNRNDRANGTPFSVPSSSYDIPPRILERTPPVYPYELRSQGVHGTVVVEFIIDVDGSVRDAVVVRSSHLGFETPALDAIRQWRFAPARKGGADVDVSVSQTFEFNPDN